jgi:signal peptide peptidase SppA
MKYVQESIFSGAIRSFCKTFAGAIGILIAIVLIGFGIAFVSGQSYLPEKSEITIAPDDKGQRELLPESAPAILRIDIHGIIGDIDITTEKIETILLDSREGFLKNNRVKAVLLHMNTPGGEATNADGIYRALMRYKEKYQVPIYVYVDGICASGGMYISAAADKIYASPTSVIGSIGIILGPTFNVSQAMDKLGIQSLTLTEGKDKDMLNPFRPWKPGEDQSLKDIVASLYDRFVSIMTTSRPQLTRQKLISDFGAQIYVAPKAQELGYIDEGNSDYDSTLKDLARAANISEGQNYQLVQLSIPRSFLSELADGKSPLLKGKVIHSLDLGIGIPSELNGKLLYLYQP